ncbi:transferrin-binding protein-like solute binding protein [Moraxella sp. ZY200743]|uniref:transferrin-binding protein-like solute binding protein n=1 Tax=Moraxella sp. ZY200743 TaxID=2911970 RepID=UPI003D7E1214
MKFYTKKPLAIIVGGLLLTACASGKGSFDLDNVSSLNTQGASQNTGNSNTPKEPTYQDEKGERRTLDISSEEPALGFISEIPRRGNRTDGVQIGEVQAINHTLEDLPKYYEDILNKQPRASGEVVYSHDKGTLSRTRDMQYVRSGYIIDAEAGVSFVTEADGKRQMYSGSRGYVFYQGVIPSTILPTQKVIYTGTWDFTSDTDKTRTQPPSGFTRDNQSSPANMSGATPLDAYVNNNIKNAKIAHGSRFEVDFTNKTLTGDLYSHGYVATESKAGEQVDAHRYHIDGKLSGNRFVGTAIAQDKTHGIFGKDGVMEGGFFGEKAEEMAGKFLAEDKSLFGVFGAKREALDDAKLQTRFDATVIDSDTVQKSRMDTFGQVSHLVINGKRLPLLPDNVKSFADMDFVHTRQVEHDGKKLSVTVCCNNLDYVKFGSYGAINDDNGVITIKDGKLFLVGERTDIDKIPQAGKAHYRGTWEGDIVSKDGRKWSVSASGEPLGARSRFDVDFGTKEFLGKLIGDNGVEELPILNLNGVINANGFSGKATTREGGFNLDPSSTGASAIAHINANFYGGFYGADASELGGVIHHDKAGEDKIGVVFGAKRQTQTP